LLPPAGFLLLLLLQHWPAPLVQLLLVAAFLLL
jgi:hypothetical protein